MLSLTESLLAWSTPDFSRTLKNELQATAISRLPLDKGTSQGGYVDDQPITVSVNRFNEADDCLEGSVDVFFTEIVINCGCGDDPMPVNGYCELRVMIDKQTAATTLEVITG